MIRIGIVGCGQFSRHTYARLSVAAGSRRRQLSDHHGNSPPQIRPFAAMYVRRGKALRNGRLAATLPAIRWPSATNFSAISSREINMRIYTDYREMIADGPIDAVNDFSTHALHHQVAAAAFQSGKHLMSQKPLALTVAAARSAPKTESRNLTSASSKTSATRDYAPFTALGIRIQRRRKAIPGTFPPRICSSMVGGAPDKSSPTRPGDLRWKPAEH